MYTFCNSSIVYSGLFSLLLPLISQADQFDIQPQPLGSALKPFSETTNYQFIFTDSVIEHTPTGGVTGDYPAKQALKVLLEGTRIRYRHTNDNTVILYRDGEATNLHGLPQAVQIAQAGTSSSARKAPLMVAQVSQNTSTNRSGRLASANKSRALEEIVVTARKREEGLQDVPISIYAASGDYIRSLALKDLQELTDLVPNVTIFRDSSADLIQIRGFGSGQNPGFEQAVGTMIDGYFYGSQRFSRIGFLDVDQVEILKGPQGALIGKNTTAGVLSVTTANPTDEFTAWGEIQYDIEGTDGPTFEGALSGPLTDNLKARVALKYLDTDGWVKNTANGQDQPSLEDWTSRIKLQWEPSANMDMLLQWTHHDSSQEGEETEKFMCSPVTTGFFAARNIPLECNLDFKRQEIAPVNGVGNADNREFDTDSIGMSLNWKFGEHTLTSLTNYARLEAYDRSPGDRMPLELGNTRQSEDYQQWSQELRITSPTGGQFEYLAGVFYQQREKDSLFALDITLAALGIPVIFGDAILTNEEGNTMAAFGQLTWNINQEWAASIDGRYTREEKEATQIEIPVTIYTLDQVGPNRHFLNDERDENNFSPGFSLQWKPDELTNIYGSIRTGFKSGGFNHQVSNNQALAEEAFEFQDEEVVAYELGAKMTLADGSLQINTAIFRNEFDDIQVDILARTPSGVPIARIANAASVTTQGFEIDAIWKLTDNLTLSGAAGYLDATFDNYSGAGCYFQQTPAQGCNAGDDGIPGTSGIPDSDEDDFQDLSGQVLPRAPEWSASINAEYTWPLTGNLELTGFVQGIFSDEYSMDIDNDPVLFQDSFWKLNARLTLRDVNGRWEVSLIGRNLTDELTTIAGSDVPGLFPGHAYRANTDPPRVLTLQGRVRF